MKIKIAHCSDIHIGVRCGNFDNEVSKILSEDTKRAFFDMLKICDDEEVDAVSKVTVKMEMDFDNGIANALADALTDSVAEKEITCVKVDGDWYIYEN